MNKNPSSLNVPDGQSLQSHMAAPNGKTLPLTEVDGASSDEAPCSAATCSGNRQLVESIDFTFETLNEKGEVILFMSHDEQFMIRINVFKILIIRLWLSAKFYNLESPSFRVFENKAVK